MTDWATPPETEERYHVTEPPRTNFEALAVLIAQQVRLEIFGVRIWLRCERDQRDPAGRLYYQIGCERPDTFTGEMGEGRGGKMYLSEAMLEDELVQGAWGLFDAYVHHEAREGFLWRDRRIYGPHQKVDNLWEIAEDIVTR